MGQHLTPGTISKGYVAIDAGQIHYRCVDGPGAPIILLHRTPVSSASFAQVLGYLAGVRKVYAFDTPGFGQSFLPEAAPKAADYGAWFLQAVDQLGIEEFHLGAHRVDYLVNSAGVTGSHSAELVYRVNVLGLQHLTEQLLPRIRDNGSVINVASGAGIDWPKNLPAILPIIQAKEQPVRLRQCLQHASEGGRAYNFSKEIIIVLTKRLAKKEWARGVSVNSVSPGGVLTGMIPEFRSSMGEIVDWSIDKVGRHAEPVEIARPILWLTSEDAGWVNGADLVVDGGLLAGIQVGSFALGE